MRELIPAPHANLLPARRLPALQLDTRLGGIVPVVPEGALRSPLDRHLAITSSLKQGQEVLSGFVGFSQESTELLREQVNDHCQRVRVTIDITHGAQQLQLIAEVGHVGDIERSPRIRTTLIDDVKGSEGGG